MKIAVDYQSVAGQKTGIGHFTSNLFEAIRRENPGIDFVFYGSRNERMNAPARIVWESVQIPLRTWRDRPDLVYSPGFAPAAVSPARQIVTVHDLIGLAHPSNQRGGSHFYWSRWLPWALKRAHRLVAISEWTRRDLERYLGIDPSRVRVVYQAANSCFRNVPSRDTMKAAVERFGLSGAPFFVAVGSLEPRKNLLRLVQAYERLARGKNPGFRIALTGKPAGAEHALTAFVKEKGLENEIRFLGYVKDDDLTALYGASLGYAMVSLYEGFGLPVLEAMCCGKSGVVSNRTSLPEVTGDTAIAVDPENVDAIAEALRVYATDGALRSRLEAAALARSRRFDPQEQARAMIEAFREAAA